MMCMTLGGRAAEKVFFNSITTGAQDDLSKITKMAYAQVTQYGMSTRVGNISYSQDKEGFTKPYSEDTASRIDEEVRLLISNAYDRTVKLVEERRAEIEAVANRLLEKEVIGRDDLIDILGAR